MNNFWQRLITGVIFLTILISGILINQWTFAFLFLIISILAQTEFYNIIKKHGYKPIGNTF